MPPADLFGDGDRGLFFEGREARANGGHGDGAVTEDLVRDRVNERAVDAARVADKRRSHLLDEHAKSFELRIGGHDCR